MVGIQRRLDLVMDGRLGSAMFGCSRLNRTGSAYEPSWVIMLELSKIPVKDNGMWWLDENNDEENEGESEGKGVRSLHNGGVGSRV